MRVKITKGETVFEYEDNCTSGIPSGSTTSGIILEAVKVFVESVIKLTEK